MNNFSLANRFAVSDGACQAVRIGKHANRVRVGRQQH